MLLIRKAVRALAMIVVAVGSTGIAPACSCAPPPPRSRGALPTLHVPSLNDGSTAFVGIVEDVYPSGKSAYEARWYEMFNEEISESRPPSVDQVRKFVMQLWPSLFSL